MLSIMNVFTAAPLTKIVQSYSTCSSTSGTNQFDLADKTITAGRCRVALEQCTGMSFSELSLRSLTEME